MKPDLDRYCPNCLLWRACQGSGKRRALRRGDMAIIPEQPVRHVFLLLDGLAATFRTSESGHDNLAAFMLPGDFWGLTTLYEDDNAKPLLFDMDRMDRGGEHCYESRAIVPSVFCKVTGERFLTFIERDHQLAMGLMKRQVAFFRNQTRLHSFSAKGQGFHRLIALLLIIAERVGKPTEDGLASPLELHHEDLAQLTGLSRPVLTRNLLELRKLNLISIEESMICLRDIPGLGRALRREQAQVEV